MRHPLLVGEESTLSNNVALEMKPGHVPQLGYHGKDPAERKRSGTRCGFIATKRPEQANV